MMKGNYKSAVQNLRRSKWRTFFTMLGIIIGIASVVTIVSLGDGLKSRVGGQINQLGSDVITVRPGKLVSQNGGTSSLNLYAFLAPSTLTAQDISSLHSLPTVESVTPIEYLTNSAKGTKGQFDDVFVAATTENFPETLHQTINYGSFFSDSDPSDNSAIIGNDVASRLFGILNPVGQTITIMGHDFIVRGVLAQTQGGLATIAQADFNSSVFIPVSAANSLTDNHTSILQILVRVKKGSDMDKAAAAVTAAIAKNHGGGGDFTVLKPSQLLGVADQVINTVTKFITMVAAIALIVGGIGIMNTMLVSVSERTREIGIRKAIGATNRQIRQQFLVEGLMLSVIAGIIGVIVSLIINLLLRLYSDWQPTISVPVLVLAVVVSIAFGVIFSLIPAVKAARKDPIEALRGE